MDWERVNVWTNTLYTLIHSIHLSKQIHFGNLDYIEESITEAGRWIAPECSYHSVLVPYPFGRSRPTFRRDPNKHFPEISRQLVKMLIQDLVVILDEMMSDCLTARGIKRTAYPQSKVHQLNKFLDARYQWSGNGCLELIAARNVLVHADGRWNKKSIAIVKHFLTPTPIDGEVLVIGIPMLFRYRKAIRTFLNQTLP